MIKRPMLAATLDDENSIKFPVNASEKLDGIRVLKIDGKLVSRSMKPIRNEYIKDMLTKILPDGADGEIIAGDNFQECSSLVMSKEGEPKFKFYWFDYVEDDLSTPYYQRIGRAFRYWLSKLANCPFVEVWPGQMIYTVEDLHAFEQKTLDAGYEGVMLRDIHSPYKCGRSTGKEGYLLKLKRFVDSEAIIIGLDCRYKNLNPDKINELGYLTRSTSISNLVPEEKLGSLIVKDCQTKQTFSIGSGFNDAQREKFWQERESLIGKIVKYKHFSQTGVKEAPRFPIFLGFRDPDDL